MFYLLKGAENFWVLTCTLILQCYYVSTMPVPTCPPSPFTGEYPWEMMKNNLRFCPGLQILPIPIWMSILGKRWTYRSPSTNILEVDIVCSFWCTQIARRSWSSSCCHLPENTFFFGPFSCFMVVGFISHQSEPAHWLHLRSMCWLIIFVDMLLGQSLQWN